jgi:hypothetical protein
MGNEKNTGAGFVKMNTIYQSNAVYRSIIIFLGFQALLWLVFGISYVTHKEAWHNVAEVEPITAAVGGWWSTFGYIIINNLIVCALIIVGNLFVRFASFTPGLVVLIVQALMIGWLAGSNGFEIPFATVAAANMQFLKIGLLETMAYALACAVTLPKSLLISETFPAKEWAQKRTLKDIKFSKDEIIIAILGAVLLITAGIIETFVIFS